MYWIEKATAHPDFTVTIQWRDGAESTVDFKPNIAKGGVCEPMADPDYFTGKMQVDEDGRSLGWPGEVDFCADSLWYRTHPEDLERGFSVWSNRAMHKFVRITMKCTDYGDKTQSLDNWPFWFDLLIDEENSPVRDIDGYYFGGHKFSDMRHVSGNPMYPMRLDPKDSSIFGYVDGDDGLEEQEYGTDLLEQCIVEGAMVKLWTGSKDENNLIMSYYRIVCIQIFCIGVRGDK